MPYNYMKYCSRRDKKLICLFCIITAIGASLSIYTLISEYSYLLGA